MVILRQPQLYRYFNYCNDIPLERRILDCGAGGAVPPLALFAACGYETYGLDISQAQIDKAEAYAAGHGLNLNIAYGDIRALPFDDESFPFAYSYNTIFHMTKADIRQAVHELKRVLKPGGLLCVNFLTIHDGWYGDGKEVGPNEFLQMERGEEVIHSYYEVDEGEKHFEDGNMEIVYKENRILNWIYEGQPVQQGYVDYFVRKKGN